MSFERGDLVLIPFPFTDLSSSKRRPVLALTRPDSRGDFVSLPVTSRPQGDPALPLGEADITAGGLPRSSWVRVDHPVTLHAGLVMKVVARARTEIVREAVCRLCAVLGAPTTS